MVIECVIDNYWLINSGLVVGDCLIIEGMEKVSVGDEVRLVEVSIRLFVVVEFVMLLIGEK